MDWWAATNAIGEGWALQMLMRWWMSILRRVTINISALDESLETGKVGLSQVKGATSKQCRADVIV